MENIIIKFLITGLTALGLTVFHSLIYAFYLESSFLAKEEVNLLNIFYLLFFVFLGNWGKRLVDFWGTRFSFLLSSFSQGLGLILYAWAYSFLSLLLADAFLATGIIIFLSIFRKWTIDSFSISPLKDKTEGDQFVSGLKLLILWSSFLWGQKNLVLSFSLFNLIYWMTMIVVVSFQEEKKRQELKWGFEFNRIVRKNILLFWQADIFLLIIGLGFLIALSSYFVQCFSFSLLEMVSKKELPLAKIQIHSLREKFFSIGKKMTFSYPRTHTLYQVVR